MSDKSIVDRYAQRVGTDPGLLADSGESDLPEDCGAFGWLRGIRDRAIMLELRRSDGNIMAISYGWLERAEFDPSDGIILLGGGQKVRILGRNLNAEVRPSIRLFEGIVRARVPWLRQADRADNMQAGDKDTVVESIEW